MTRVTLEFSEDIGLIDPTATALLLREVARERGRQDLKWGPERQEHSILEWLSIEAEEFGEWGQAINAFHFGGATPERYRRLRDEIIQTAAVAVCAAENLDRQYAKLLAEYYEDA